MYAYRVDTHKYRWRKYAAAALYALFLLAESGEFFVSRAQERPPDTHTAESSQEMVIPDHLPENKPEKELISFKMCFKILNRVNKSGGRTNTCFIETTLSTEPDTTELFNETINHRLVV